MEARLLGSVHVTNKRPSQGLCLAGAPAGGQTHVPSPLSDSCCCWPHLHRGKSPAASVPSHRSCIPLAGLAHACGICASCLTQQGQVTKHSPSKWASQRTRSKERFPRPPPGCSRHPVGPACALRNTVPTLLVAYGPRALLHLKLLLLFLQKQGVISPPIFW